MRPYCPVCGGKDRIDDWELSFKIPDGWELPSKNIVCLCKACGMIWYDNDASQADYDRYYASRYVDFGLDTPEHKMRQEGIVGDVSSCFKKHMRIADFGGGLGYITNRLRELGFTDVTLWNVGDPEPHDVDLIIASHVLEHVYDLTGVMGSFGRALKPRGFVIVEVPDANHYALLATPPLLDYQTQHINHFTPACLDRLFEDRGFTKFGGGSSPFQQYTNCRAVYYMDGHRSSYRQSRHNVAEHMRPMVKHLEAVHRPVIVYGCSDTTWYLLDKVPGLEVAYYVDENTDAYPPGSTIGGVPVVQSVTTDHPIVIMAAGQRAAILDKIRTAGLKNEVIEI